MPADRAACVVAADLDAEKLAADARHEDIATERLDALDPAAIAAFAAPHPGHDALFTARHGYRQRPRLDQQLIKRACSTKFAGTDDERTSQQSLPFVERQFS